MNPTSDRKQRERGTAWAVTVTSLAAFLVGLDNLIVITALPAMREDLGGGIEELEWTVNAYILTFAVLLLLGAALGDRFGRRKIFLLGIAVFTAASAAAALATSTDAMIGARAVQGLGGAMLMPLSLTLLTAAVPPERLGAAFGIWGAANGLAVATGPLIGGAITEHISWEWIFWINVPVGVALLPLTLMGLRESRGPNSRLDMVGTALASLGLFAITFSLVRANTEGWTDGTILTGLFAGAALLVAFVVWESRTDAPMLPMRLFRSRAFSTVNAAAFLMYTGMFGAVFLLTQFLQTIQGYSPFEAGLRMLPWTAMLLVVAPLAGMLSDRIGGRPVVATGLTLMTIGLAWLTLIAEPDVSYARQAPAFVVSGIGMAMFFAPIAAMVMGAVSQDDQGAASGANNALREAGGVLGVALLSAVFSRNGGYGSPDAFTDGMKPALWTAVVLGILATAAMLLSPKGARLQSTPPPAQKTPTPTA
ncbi:DHA2 family efflux MFS transporter permease subunit [Streptomyces sp. NPDC013181]|uniref:DHA2 family efflux MFS transporter permease subunit n=1 Tax=Streptomyces sp. NPDC013181 TaxID=3364864 RepID=UPI0036A7FFC4